MKVNQQTSAARFRIFSAPVLLLVILGVLFCKSFLPEFVHFNNDGPLGPQSANWLQLPSAFTGMWDDLNDIGFSGGAYPPSISATLAWSLGSVGFAKFLAPVALFILGLGAWTFFRQLKLTPLAAILGALATALNSTFFASACWGVAAQQIAIGMDFFALALAFSNTSETPFLTRLTRLALAGLLVGVNVMEAADIGAILSVFVATFIFIKTLTEEKGTVLLKAGKGIMRVAVVAVFAGFIAAQTVLTLVGTQITGIAGTGQDTETKEQHWDWATQWSMPKVETLGLFVPGLFGYKMDTPKDMAAWLQDSYKGGNYWGGVGRDPAIDRYFDSGEKGPQPPGFMRFTGGGNYVGILVALVAIWAIAQSFRRKDSVFTDAQRRLLWFLAVVLVGSLLLSWGRFAPFDYYKHTIYTLPYFSTIRNPTKFIIVFSMAIVVLFAYGIHGLSRRYLETPTNHASPVSSELKSWWAKVRGFDRNWTLFSVATLISSFLAWGIYVSQKPALVTYLQKVGFDESMAGEIASFSFGQVGWFLLFFVLAVGLCILIIAGIFSGRRAKLGGILLGTLLVIDLGRANLPWIIHWDYKQKYEIGSLNPVEDFLRNKPYEHRVAKLLPAPLSTPSQFGLFDQLYALEWTQHHFPYYNIQSLDIIQMSRMPEDLQAYIGALRIGIKQDATGQYMLDDTTFPRLTRRWELSNTRYLLGPAAFVDSFNQQFDPGKNRFRILQRFEVVPKLGVDLQELQEEFQHGEWHGEKLTAVPKADGNYALIEFTGALPRAKLYSNWQLNTNNEANLKTLADLNFDPAKTVLISTPEKELATVSTNENSGTVEFKSYAPKKIVFAAKADAPSILLLNDKYDPQWRVSVDGKPAQLLRCNFIMRGVYLSPGEHTVEFQFYLPNGPLYITLTAIGVGVVLFGILFFLTRHQPSA